MYWPVWIHGWGFVYKLSGCGFENSCSHLRLFPHQYKTQQICDKVILENGRILKSVPDTATKIKKCVIK